MSPERIYFRADASPALGFGHVARVCALIEETKAAGFEPVPLLGGDTAALDAWIAGRFAYEPGPWTPEATARRIAGTDVRALFVDGPAIARTLLPELPGALRAVLIDDAGSDAAVATVVNHNVHAAELAYPGAQQKLLGRRFLMLRRDVRRYLRGSAWPDPPRGERLRVLVTFGASDPSNATARVLAMLAPDRPLDVCVIVGPGYRDRASLEAAAAVARAAGHRVEVACAPADSAGLFVSANAAICAAGGTLGELAYLGCPALAYAVAPDQLLPARRQVREGLIAGGRRWADVDDDALRTDLLRFVLDDAGRRTQRLRALASVDADGARRIIQLAL